ncbi:MAG: RluA family pseudouridine synthase, partial [Planctomycetaceae bacterium]
PKTGRTHQLRVHMTPIGHPLVAARKSGGGDRLRLSELAPSPDATNGGEDDTLIARQALHAHRLAFRHPSTNEAVELTAPLPADFLRTLDALRRHRPLR